MAGGSRAVTTNAAFGSTESTDGPCQASEHAIGDQTGIGTALRSAQFLSTGSSDIRADQFRASRAMFGKNPDDRKDTLADAQFTIADTRRPYRGSR